MRDNSDGVPLRHANSFILFTDARGNVYGPAGNSNKTSPLVYQWLIDPLASKFGSAPITVP